MIFIQENLDIIIVVLSLMVVALTVMVWILLGEVSTNKENISGFITWFNTTFSPEITDDIHNQKVQYSEYTVALWEYFYAMLAVNGVLTVNPETFLTDGANDLVTRCPSIKDLMELDKNKNQAVVFTILAKHYANGVPQANKKETPKEIFDKYKPDRPIL